MINKCKCGGQVIFTNTTKSNQGRVVYHAYKCLGCKKRFKQRPRRPKTRFQNQRS